MSKLKWMGLCLLVPVMTGLVGCGADDESAAQARAADGFQQAGRHLMTVADGYVGDPAATDLAAYQQQQLQEASRQYAEIANTGSPGQQVSAALGLAEANATAARHLTQQAVDTWSKLSPISKQAVPTLASARGAWTLAEAHRKLDQSAELQAAQQQVSLAQGQLEVAQGRLKEQQVLIDDLTAQRDAMLGQRAQLIAQADDLNRRSFEATGQMRFDLYAQAAEVTRSAEQIGVEADKLAARINVEESRNRVVEIEQAQAQDRIAAVDTVMESYAKRREQIGSTTETAQADADKYAQQLVTVLQQRAEQHTQLVQQPLDQSKQLMDAAVSALRPAVNKAGDSRSVVQLALACKQAEAAHLLRQAASIHRGHADLMQLMADNTKEGFPPQQAELVSSLAEQAKNLADGAQTDAEAALVAAAEDLSTAAESQSEELMKAAREQLLDVYVALIAMTGDEQWTTKADEVRLQLNPPPPQPEGATPAPAEGEVAPQPEAAPEAPAETAPEAPTEAQPEAPGTEVTPPAEEVTPQPQETQPVAE